MILVILPYADIFLFQNRFFADKDALTQENFVVINHELFYSIVIKLPG